MMPGRDMMPHVPFMAANETERLPAALSPDLTPAQGQPPLASRQMLRVMDALEQAMMDGLLDHVVTLRAIELGWKPPPQ